LEVNVAITATGKHYYPALVDKDPDSDMSVLFPDFPGCVSAGDTLDEALRNAEEALAGHIGIMLADGDDIPEPTPLDVIARQSDATTIAVALVPVVFPGKARRVNVMLDEGLLSEIDRVTDNRSRFLADAARGELARRRA
jgi:predicted RNase H-like HicB family nuclease